jgi:hypothetical protein
MSIIDQAREEAERLWVDYPHVGFSAAQDRQNAFADGAQWLLDQLTDPDPETVDAVARQLNHDGWTCWDGEHEPDHFDDCADCRVLCRAMARAAITALTNHLEGGRP